MTKRFHENEKRKKISAIVVEIRPSMHSPSDAPSEKSAPISTPSISSNGPQNSFRETACRVLYGVIVRGKWSGNAILIAPYTFLAPKHLFGGIQNLGIENSFQKYRFSQKRFKDSWKKVFQNCVLLVPAEAYCSGDRSQPQEIVFLKALAMVRAPISQSDSILVYARPLPREISPLSSYTAQLDFFPTGAVGDVLGIDMRRSIRAFAQEACERASVTGPLPTGELVLILWLDPFWHAGSFRDPTCISDWTYLVGSRENGLCYTLSQVIDYVGHPYHIVQTVFADELSAPCVSEILHLIQAENVFHGRARYVETTSAGASGGLVFHVAKAGKATRIGDRLRFVGIHIGRNTRSEKFSSAGKQSGQIETNAEEVIIGEFCYMKEMLRSIPHPLEYFH